MPKTLRLPALPGGKARWLVLYVCCATIETCGPVCSKRMGIVADGAGSCGHTAA
ncbi:hypothetical protein [Comamonas aquatica]|uniref:hypothetical protein n=1 Tax=Comamonas aquatica TaxID=225991 RepID=UPI001B38B0C6|nr:hypothetical protein [Comamonas aquatica]QTX22551.1 hypothetical protein KAQ61_09170 [Comamonas aquatica]